jgi:hypothetical protein
MFTYIPLTVPLFLNPTDLRFVYSLFFSKWLQSNLDVIYMHDMTVTFIPNVGYRNKSSNTLFNFEVHSSLLKIRNQIFYSGVGRADTRCCGNPCNKFNHQLNSLKTYRGGKCFIPVES